MEEKLPTLSGWYDSLALAAWPRAALEGLKILVYMGLLMLVPGLVIAVLQGDILAALGLSLNAPGVFFPAGLVSGKWAASRAATWLQASLLGAASSFVPVLVNLFIAEKYAFSAGYDVLTSGIGLICAAGWLVCGISGGLICWVRRK